MKNVVPGRATESVFVSAIVCVMRSPRCNGIRAGIDEIEILTGAKLAGVTVVVTGGLPVVVTPGLRRTLYVELTTDGLPHIARNVSVTCPDEHAATVPIVHVTTRVELLYEPPALDETYAADVGTVSITWTPAAAPVP